MKKRRANAQRLLYVRPSFEGQQPEGILSYFIPRLAAYGGRCPEGICNYILPQESIKAMEG
jgi:hypothetical protein